MIRLELFRNDDEIVFIAIDVRKYRWFWQKDEGSTALAFIKPGPTIALNREILWERKELLLLLPQTFLHEILHWISRYDLYSTCFIHKIHKWTKGVLL